MKLKGWTKRLNVGKVKLWGERLRSYLMWAQFAMIVYLFTLEKPLGLGIVDVLSLVAVVSVVVIIFDIKVVLPQEYSYVFEKTPPLNELRNHSLKKLAKIEKLLK